ncbi:MAG: SusD/RagB family nutrient-binding outer membrane lipoprotein [Limnohabitans sp.]|nr:SusD/RagB family nutrient-binding outer membrane lipoprotein [Limnohabitans sp.]
MKKTIILKKIGLIALLPVLLSSCSRELDINIDPNVPSDAPLKNLLASPEVNLAYTLGGNINRMSSSVMQYYAGHRAQPLEYGQYNITSASTDNLWTAMYNTAMDLKLIENKAKSTNSTVYLGISQILTAYTFSVTTDLFGDIPYTEALKGTLNITPKYDKQQDIYPSLISLIDQGIANVKANQGLKPTTDDLIYGGNIVKWERFGNSLKLRLYNHLSKRSSNASDALNFLNTNPILINDSADDAKLTFLVANNNSNPIYQFDELSGRKDNAVCATLVNKMSALSDPRSTLYFKGVKNGALAGQIIGNLPGQDDDDSGETKYSRVGSAYASNNSPVMLLSAAEVNFIKSEVYFRSGNNTNAQTSFNKAITEDFISLKVGSTPALSTTAANTYLSNPSVAFNNTLERIIEQKWITMFQASFESWVDWRRTNFPTLTVPTRNFTSNVIPRKLPYPQIEINVNRASLEQGPGVPIPYVSILNKVWWDN